MIPEGNPIKGLGSYLGKIGERRGQLNPVLGRSEYNFRGTLQRFGETTASQTGFTMISERIMR